MLRMGTPKSYNDVAESWRHSNVLSGATRRLYWALETTTQCRGAWNVHDVALTTANTSNIDDVDMKIKLLSNGRKNIVEALGWFWNTSPALKVNRRPLTMVTERV